MFFKGRGKEPRSHKNGIRHDNSALCTYIFTKGLACAGCKRSLSFLFSTYAFSCASLMLVYSAEASEIMRFFFQKGPAVFQIQPFSCHINARYYTIFSTCYVIFLSSDPTYDNDAPSSFAMQRALQSKEPLGSSLARQYDFNG